MTPAPRLYAGFTPAQVEALKAACSLTMTANEHGDYTGMNAQAQRALVAAYSVLIKLGGQS